MAFFRRPLTIVVPNAEIGLEWRGGNQYIANLTAALQSLKRERLFWLRTDSTNKSQRGLNLLHNLRGSKATTHLPWTLVSHYDQMPPTIETQWIPDFQDIELPQFFSSDELKQRRDQIASAITRGTNFYVGSHHASTIATSVYPELNLAGVVRFSCKPELVVSDRSAASSVSNCPSCQERGYIYWPSQWWKHKNHVRVITAISQSDFRGPHVVISGSESDYRWPEYALQVRRMLHNSHQFHVLGNVPEAERNWLLSNCLAVFQPSLYEGWSTTIEEAISFGKLVLASSIPPNLEQLSDYPPKFFFDPNNENSIISCLSHLTSNTAPNLLTVEELSEIRVGRWHRFRQDLLNLIRTILSQH